MKKQLKDPRPLLVFFFRLSLITLIFIPLIYFNLKSGRITNLILIFVGWLVIIFLIKKFCKVDEEDRLHNIIVVGYMFSVLWFILVTGIILVLLSDYFKQGTIFPITAIILTNILLFFGIILLYLSYKSTKYEKS